MMDAKQYEGLRKELEAIKQLIALQLKKTGVDVTSIGRAMGVSAGRVSQILGEKKKKAGSNKRK